LGELLRSGSDSVRRPILIVDADAHFRVFVATTLSRAGYAAREASSGEDALSSVLPELPSLILLDVCLPDISGFEVCRELRDRFGTELPIVFVSGVRTEPLDRSVGLLVGGDDYLVKPVDPNELLARVRRLLARSRREQETVSAPREVGLTKREMEVLQRLAEGLRHAEIAAELVISPKTVASHIQHILAKLGVHSRAEAIAFAHNSGLL
jgi:DNA-binding NarL/FixJ family response regulator